MTLIQTFAEILLNKKMCMTAFEFEYFVNTIYTFNLITRSDSAEIK